MNKDHFFLSWQWHTEAPVFEQPQLAPFIKI